MSEITQQSIDLKPQEITKQDVTFAWLRWYYANEIPHSFDRYLAASLMWALIPILKKLYKDKSELAAAYQRHLLFFNTQVTWGGGTITGIMASLESARANEIYEKKPVSIDDNLLYNTKAGLMGALAGIGDAIDSGTIQYIFIAIALPWAQEGSVAGALFPFISFISYQLFVGYYFTQLGFKLGRNAGAEVIGAKMQMIIEGLSILGLFMMGILAASYINVSSSLEFNISGKKFVMQHLLDQILPGALPLLAVVSLYVYFAKKGLKVTRALVGLMIILGVLAAFGIL